MLKKIFWYLIRPIYYAQLFHLIKNKIALKFRKNHIRSNVDWCVNNAISTNEAILKITKKKVEKKVSEIYPDIFSIANRKIQKCPVKMGGSANIDLLYYLCEHLKAIKVIETGVAYGWSTLSILLSINKRKRVKLLSTNMPYPGLDNSYVGLVIPNELKKNWKLFSGADLYALPKALKFQKLNDLCHYDSDKYYEGRSWAYPMLWSSLRKGGILVSDDIENNSAFKDFSKKIKKDPIIVKFKNKNKEIGFQFVGVLIK